MRSVRLLVILGILGVAALLAGVLLGWQALTGAGATGGDSTALIAAYGRASLRLTIGAGAAALLFAALGLVAARGVGRDLDWPPGACAAVGVAAVLAQLRGAEGATSGLLSLAAVLAAGAAGLCLLRRLLPGSAAFAQVAAVVAPLGALALAALASAFRLQATALSGAEALNEYGRVDRVVAVGGAVRPLALGLAIAAGSYVAAVGLAAVRRRIFTGVGVGWLAAAALALAAVLALPVLVMVKAARGATSPHAAELAALKLPLLRQAGLPLGAMPFVLMRLQDGFTDVKMPPKGTEVVELAIDGRHEFKVLARLLEKLASAGVRRIRPVYAYPVPEALRPLGFVLRLLPMLGPLLPPQWITLKACEVTLQRVAEEEKPKGPREPTPEQKEAAEKAIAEGKRTAAAKPFGVDDRVRSAVEVRSAPPELYTPAPGTPWAQVALRLGELELVHCRLSKRRPVLGF